MCALAHPRIENVVLPQHSIQLLLSTMPQLQHSPPNYHPHIKTMDALLSRFFAPSMSSMGGSSRDRRRSRCGYGFVGGRDSLSLLTE